MFARWIEMFIYLVFLIHLRPKCPWWSTGGWLVENNKELQQNFLSLRFWQANSILPETLILRKNVPRTFFPLNRALAYDVESEYFELSPNTRIIGNWHRMRKIFYMLLGSVVFSRDLEWIWLYQLDYLACFANKFIKKNCPKWPKRVEN